MASNYNPEDEDVQLPILDNSTYNQLWQEALDVDDEVQRILHDHGIPINDDELPQPAEEDDGTEWVTVYDLFVRSIAKLIFVLRMNFRIFLL